MGSNINSILTCMELRRAGSSQRHINFQRCALVQTCRQRACGVRRGGVLFWHSWNCADASFSDFSKHQKATALLGRRQQPVESLGIVRGRCECAVVRPSAASSVRDVSLLRDLRSPLRSQDFQQYSGPMSGGEALPGSSAVLVSSLFLFKRKLSRRGRGGSPAARLLFCPIGTCQLINCASRRFAQRRICSAYQHRACGVEAVNKWQEGQLWPPAGEQHATTKTSSSISEEKKERPQKTPLVNFMHQFAPTYRISSGLQSDVV